VADDDGLADRAAESEGETEGAGLAVRVGLIGGVAVSLGSDGSSD
jgi:hypothetical protein